MSLHPQCHNVSAYACPPAFGGSVFVAALVFVLHFAAFAAGQKIEFVRDVRPILQKHCLGCHGPEKREGGLRLDVKSAAFRGGDSHGATILVVGNAAESRLVQFVSRDDAELQMPPEGERLSAQEISVLTQWVNEGAVWPQEFAGTEEQVTHWSLTHLTKPVVPTGVANPIDAFVRAKLAEKNLAPSPQADRRALIRRLNYDLTGLPPTPEEVDEFVSNPDPAAYDQLVARLLASPRYGEHWARHWLDVANYADTHGNDHDYARPNAWPYRDYVIRAFNDDKPYARFIQEQVAGDVLFPDDPQATVALGFVAAGPWDHTLMVTVREDTVDHRMAQYLDRDNMVSTVIGTFQSLTVHCARCHNHKFDPITQREYYALQAVFAGVDRADRPFDQDPKTHRMRTQLLAEKRALRDRDSILLANLETPAVSKKVADWEQRQAQQTAAWAPLDIISVVSTGGTTLTRQSDGSWFASETRPDHDTYIVTAQRPGGKLGAVRLEVLPDDRLPQKGPGRWDNGNFHLTEFRAFAAPPGGSEGARPIVFSRAFADFDEGPGISAAQAIDGKADTQWGVHPRYGEPHEAVFEAEGSPEFAANTTFTFLLEFEAGAPGHGIGRFRLTTTGESPATTILRPIPIELAKILEVPVGDRSLEQRQELALAVLNLENEHALAALPAPQFVYAITKDFPADGENFKPPAEPRTIRLLQRGELSRPGEIVEPGTLSCVPEMPSELRLDHLEDEASRRAALALWLSHDHNALTWRSIVNRVWAWHFGRGLCDSPNDFGKMGGTPSHQELLDWLAIWLRDEAHGSLKALHQLIVTSETWQQSTLSRHGSTNDSDNRLLWRQNRQRQTAEQVRDTMLALSGQLDLTMGGPPAVQFISRGDATFMAGGNPAFLDYEHFDPDSSSSRRRAIYRFLFRTVPDPFMDALDCPDGSTFTPVRSASTTPIQAFALLNDAFVIRQCEHLAARLAETNDSPEAKTEAAFRRILLRSPTETERSKMTGYIERHGLANACQFLFNSNEFLFLD
ncbi:MAG: PSD1 and planctomycete cytochrome C domain-containing protein [Pirellulaceae bacterium]